MVQSKSKEAKARAARAGGKGKKKKWSSGKAGAKLDNAVLFEGKNLEKMKTDVPKMKIITVATVSDRLKVNGSLARVGIREMEEEGLIKRVHKHKSTWIYTRATH